MTSRENTVPGSISDRGEPATPRVWTTPRLETLGGMDDVENLVQQNDDGALAPQNAVS